MSATMTDDEINIALAEVRGWLYIWNDFGVLRGVGPQGTKAIPDHLNGIEALGNIHEVEKLLTDVQQLEYWAALDEVCGLPAVLFYMVHAKPRKRAEALLRTLGKWKESK